VRAFVSAVTDTELRFVVPWVNQGGDLPIELRVPASENVGRGTLAVASPPDAVDFRFAVEPLDVPRSPQAVLSTGLGPAFVLATSGRRSAAERALEAQRRLNEAAGPLKASRDVTFEVRDLETNPSLGLAGRPETILEVTEEDAAAYNEDWTRLGGQGGRVTRERLALWWQALARDLVLLLVRGERPRHAVALAREGRVLSDVFDAAQRTGRFGVPWAVVASAKAPMIAAIRTLALRVPATVRGVVPEPTTGAASTPRPAPAGPLRLEGVWVGSELEGGRRRFLTVSFRGRGGSFTYEGGISVSMPLLSVEQPGRDRVRFTVEESGGRRFYDAEWDGRKLMGRISSGRDLRGDVGAFELTRR
jgi:hypothetical protein